jgi:dephospho-CoA kinase
LVTCRLVNQTGNLIPMIRIGLTGGIGSGKSTVAKIFEVLGIPVYYADDAARQLMNENEQLRADIIRHFGEESYASGQLNRSYIASIVFGNNEKLELLNSLIHPITIRHAADWMKLQKTPYIIKEAALIFETGSAEHLDYVIGVYSPKAVRIKRVMDRDGATEEQVLKRMDRQMNEEMKMRLCDFVIKNTEQELVLPQVLALHEKFLKMDHPK